MPSLSSLRIALAALIGFAGLGCGPTADAPATSETGRASAPTPVPATRRPTLVSLAPPASHFVLALEAQHLLLGVDAASARIPGLEDLPVVDDLADAALLAPDLVLLPAPPDPGDPTAEALRADGVALIPFTPHDLEDVFELVRDVGSRLVGAARAQAFETRLARPLAAIGGDSFGRPRPRVLAVVGLDPLVVAGGHSFQTDLIEIAGGSSITHGGEEPLLELAPEALAQLRPDLVLVVGPNAPSEAERRAALEALPPEHRVEFYTLDPETFWLRDAAEPARRLRAVIEPIARQLERPPQVEGS